MTFTAHHFVGTGLGFMPGEDDMVITCGLDRFVKVWNLREASAGMSADQTIMSSSTLHKAANGEEQRLPVLALRGNDCGLTHLSCFKRLVRRRPNTAAASMSATAGKDAAAKSPLQILVGGIDQRLLLWNLMQDMGPTRAVALPLHAFYRGKEKNQTTMR